MFRNSKQEVRKKLRYAIKVSKAKNQESNIKGFATVTFGDSFKITNIAILENKGRRELFVQIILTAMLESVCAVFHPTEEQIQLFIEMFVGRLPSYIKDSLIRAALVA